jgi:hypothetical protein
VIEGIPPVDWRALQNSATQILSESGFEARSDVDIPLARGRVRVDVLARDPSATPPATYICECKLWHRAVPKHVVHSFRTVIADAGAHRGFLISSVGFQDGAREAAQHSNIDLVTWSEFQQLFAERWFRTFMVPTLIELGEPLLQYTEPINSRIERAAGALSPERRARFRELQGRYDGPVWPLWWLWRPGGEDVPRLPELPLRRVLHAAFTETRWMPANILDATALRPLMMAVSGFYRQATAEFDEVFGGTFSA